MSKARYRYHQAHPVELSVQERGALEALLTKGAAADLVRIQVGSLKPVALPASLGSRILAMLRLAVDGVNPEVQPRTRALTTQQVARQLGVSRPHVVALIESGQIAALKVGTHRRILPADLAAYQTRQMAARSKALSRLMHTSRHLGLGY